MSRIAFAIFLVASCVLRIFANEAAVLPAEEREAIGRRIVEKAKAGPGPVTAAMLAPELAAIDALLAKQPEKTEDAAQTAILKAVVYWRFLKDNETSKRLFTSILHDYEGTTAPAVARSVLDTMTPEAQAKADERQEKLRPLIGQPAPELHFSWASRPGLTTLSSLKGSVVVLDFWATWCGPCIASFPQLREDVAHFADTPVVFVGVTSFQGFVSNLGSKPISSDGDPTKEIALMLDFMKAKDMTWTVGITEEPVLNPDYGVEGLPSVAIIAPDGTARHLQVDSLDIPRKVTALLKEFNLPIPRD